MHEVETHMIVRASFAWSSDTEYSVQLYIEASSNLKTMFANNKPRAPTALSKPLKQTLDVPRHIRYPILWEPRFGQRHGFLKFCALAFRKLNVPRLLLNCVELHKHRRLISFFTIQQMDRGEEHTHRIPKRHKGAVCSFGIRLFFL